MATKSPRSQAFFLGTRLVDRQRECFSPSELTSNFRRLLRLFTPQAAEASQIHPSSPLAVAAWSCLSSEKISGQKKSQEQDKKNISTWGYVCLATYFYAIIPAFIAYCQAYTLFEYILG